MVTEYTVEGPRTPGQLVRFPRLESIGKFCSLWVVANMDVDRDPAAPGWGELVEGPLEGLKEVEQFRTRTRIQVSLTQRNVGCEPRSQAIGSFNFFWEARLLAGLLQAIRQALHAVRRCAAVAEAPRRWGGHRPPQRPHNYPSSRRCHNGMV